MFIYYFYIYYFNKQKKSTGSRHPCIVPDLKGKAFSLLPLYVLLAKGVFVDALCEIEEVSIYSYFSDSIYHEGQLNFAKCFFCIT